MKEQWKGFWETHPKVKKVVGALLLLLGIISILTPLTPFGFLAIIGLEFLGWRAIIWHKWQERFSKEKS